MAALASSVENIASLVKQFGFSSIGPDKINQFRHLNFLPDMAALDAHMEKHAQLIGPKFQLVESILQEQLGDGNYGSWTQPEGGYFVSFNTSEGLATRVIELAAEAGVKLTPAGSTFPYKKDPRDCNIRLAPTYPSIDELEKAMQIFVNCVKLATEESS